MTSAPAAADGSVAPETDLGYVPFAAPVDSATTYRAIEYQGVYQATEAGKYAQQGCLSCPVTPYEAE